jgi:GNAT superfamily N-acetyltransferase
MDNRGPLVEQLTEEWMVAHHGIPGVELHRDADATWMLQAGGAWANAGVALRFSEGAAETRLDEILATYRRHGRGAGFWVSPWATPADLAARLRTRGFHCRKSFAGLYCDLASAPSIPLPPALEFACVEDPAIYLASPSGHPYRGPITNAIRRFGMHTMACLLAQRPQSVWELAVLHAGVPVAACAVYVRDRTASLWDVGVLDGFRNRGIGGALVAHACAFARDRGAACATLISSGMGEGVYCRAGFTEVCRMAYFYSALKAPS